MELFVNHFKLHVYLMEEEEGFEPSVVLSKRWGQNPVWLASFTTPLYLARPSRLELESYGFGDRCVAITPRTYITFRTLFGVLQTRLYDEPLLSFSYLLTSLLLPELALRLYALFLPLEKCGAVLVFVRLRPLP